MVLMLKGKSNSLMLLSLIKSQLILSYTLNFLTPTPWFLEVSGHFQMLYYLLEFCSARGWYAM
jgi:hypothetical protein